jgi:glycosyltransferase involved in cell wall biosynthesis
VSNFYRRKIVEHDIAAPREVTTVHNFVDASRFAPADDEGEHVLYFGRLSSEKGLYTLIDAISPLTGTPLLIAGTGAEREALEAEVARRGLDHVRFVGFQSGDDLWDLVRRSRCTVLPSEGYENCPMTVLESLACARPVVGANIGGIPELIDDGADGMLVPPGNAEALREAIAWMQAHPHQAAAMGKHGRQKVETQFSPERHVEQVLAVYDAVQ